MSKPASFTRFRIPVLLTSGVLGISSAGVLIKLLETTDAPAFGVSGWRMIYGSLLLLPWISRGSVRLGPALRAHGLSLAACAALLAVHFVTYTTSLYRNDVARTVLLYSVQPLFVTLGAWWCFAERPRAREWGFMALALAGTVVLVAGSSTGGTPTGDLLGLLAGASFAGYVLLGRHLRRHLPLAQYAAPLYLAVGVGILAAGQVQGEPLFLPEARTQLLLLALAVIPTLGGHLIFSWALRHVPSRVVSLCFLGEIPGAALLAWWVLREDPPQGVALLGALVCSAGVVGLVAAGTKAEDEPEP